MSESTRLLDKRKLRKLRRDPRAFFRDAVRNRSGAALGVLRRAAPMLPLPPAAHTNNRYSVVSAVHNVAPYLDDFFKSMARQTLSLEHRIELIMVDDGSEDESAEIIRKWQRRYPDSIRYLYKDNGGQASARNLGLGYVTGDWVTFIDPDDFVNARYFEAVDAFLARQSELEIGLVCCKWIFYHERGKRYTQDHPLNYRFEEGSWAARQDERLDFMASSAATSFYRADILARNNLLFDEKIRPNFEDGHFSGRYLLRIPDLSVGFVADALYHYRKRGNASSTLDKSWTNPKRFDVVVERGYLGLLRESQELLGHVPLSVQRLVLYDVFWYIKRIVNDEASVSFLSQGQKARFSRLLLEVFEYVDASTIARFELAGCWFFHKVGLLGLMKGEPPPYQIVYVQDYDPIKKLVQLSYFYSGEWSAERFAVDEEDVVPVSAKVRLHHFLGEVFVKERIAWVPLERVYSRLTAEIDGRPARIALGSKQHTDGVTRSVIDHEIRPDRPDRRDLPSEAIALRWMASTSAVQRKFDNAWMLIDRDSQADDNAEHLYRYILHNHPFINAYFVLSRSSHDWPRLEAEGFRLIPFGSLEHRLLLLNARHVVSSHPDAFVLNYLPRKWYGDMLRFKFTFLQHGVIRDDISRWLNTKKIDLFVTSSPREHESIAGSPSNYKFGELQVEMTGLARHDRLLEREEPTEKVVLVMPTWRQYLVGSTAVGSTSRDPSDAFYNSSYAHHWRSLLHSEGLRDLVDRHGYRVVFFPHANMQLYSDWFAAPPWVEVLTHRTEPVLQKLYRRAAVMVTDYSSVFFEMGLLQKPVVYYQFDFDEMYGGAHPSRLGYFDFERDGFGPVVETQDELIAALGEILENDAEPAPEYLRRMRETLPRRDGRNRSRIVEAIRALDSPILGETRVEELAREEAVAASKRQWWSLAERRWQSLCAQAVPRPDDRSLVALAQAKRGVGKLDEALEVLDRVTPGGQETLECRVERAEIATESYSWKEALQLWQGIRESNLQDGHLDRQRIELAIARVYRHLDQFDRAEEILDGLDPSLHRDRELAELSMARGEWREAVAQWTDMIEQRGASVPVDSWVRRARAYERLGQVDDALADLEHVEADGGCVPAAQLLRLEILAELGELSEVRKSLRAIVAEHHHSWTQEERLNLADLCRQLALFEEAEAVLSTGEIAASSAWIIEVARWETLAQGKRWRAMVESRCDWFAQAPVAERLRCKLLLVRAHRHLGQDDDALTLLDSLMVEHPDSQEVLYAYAETLHTVGRWSEAAELWQRHLGLFPEDEAQRVRARLAMALERLGREEEANRVLADSARANALERLQREPNNQQAYSQLMQLMDADGDSRREQPTPRHVKRLLES